MSTKGLGEFDEGVADLVIDVTAGVVPFSTGIQRVIRGVTEGLQDELVALVVWDQTRSEYRAPTAVELGRLGIRESSDDKVAVRDSFSTEDWSNFRWLLVPDFVHDPNRANAIRSLRRDHGFKLAYLVHDCVPLTAVETSIPAMIPAFFDYLEDLRQSDRIITNSSATAEELAAVLALQDNSSSPFPPLTTVPLAEDFGGGTYRSGVEPFAVLCVGSSEPRKNHGSLFYACEVLWQEGFDFRLDLVSSRSWLNHDEVSMFEELRKRGRDIHWHRGLSDHDLQHLYGEASLLVLPSIHEGFGLPVIEALAMGLPVITSRFGALGDLAAGGGCVTFDPNDDGELVDAIKRFLIEPSLLQTLAEQALNRERRSWQQVANEVRQQLRVDA